MPRPSPRGPDAAPSPAHDLVQRCLAGENSAWAEFLDRYGDLIYSVALRMGASRTDAEDVVQASVFAIHRALGSMRDPDRLVPWIVGVARRQTLTLFRKRAREVPDAADLPDRVDPAALSDEVAESLERAQHLRDALGSLRERCRILLFALYLREPPASYETISAETGVPIGSIGPTRARCLDALRDALESSGWEPGE